MLGWGLCWRFFFVAIAYTRTPDGLDDRNYDRKIHCNGTPVFDGLIAHRCGKVQSCYRCPSPFAAVAVGVGADDNPDCVLTKFLVDWNIFIMLKYNLVTDSDYIYIHITINRVISIPYILIHYVMLSIS